MKLKFKLVIAILSLVVLLCACNASPSVGLTSAKIVSTPAPTPTFTLEQLLADALNLLNGGSYEEAILAYNHIIEIEPKSFEAQFGLGKAYRGAKQADKAIIALKAAKEIQPENVDATLELGSALLDTGSYAEAETLLLSLAGETEFNPQAGLLLVAAYGGQGKIDKMTALMKRKEVMEELKKEGEKGLYFGAVNDKGKREGTGVGIYAEGYIYLGEYKDGLRSGHGVWMGESFKFDGVWSNDLPNGEGKEEYIGQENVTIGTWKDGLQNGEMECWFEGNPEFHDNSHLGHWKYTCIDGVPQARYKRSGKMFFAVCLECDGLNWSGATAPMGIYPFADAFDKYEVRSDNFEQ